MAKAKEEHAVKRVSIKEIRAQLDVLTAKLKEYECAANRCTVVGCKFVADGLRLSQEVERLQRENATLREENQTMRSIADPISPFPSSIPQQLE